MKNCVIGQSGGPTAVINASLCGAVCAAMQAEDIGHVYGMVNGMQGLMSEKFVNFDEIIKNEKDVNLLCNTPAAFLGSCRFKLPAVEDKPAFFQEAFAILEKHNIGYFFYIGGNDSMDTIKKMDQYAKRVGSEIKFMGIPKTVDNDLPVTDHTPGFGSAARYIAASLREIGLDSDVYDVHSVTIVEMMGRNAGWLTAAAALARCGKGTAPHLIYLPEVPFSDEQFIEDIRSLQGIGNVVVAVSEGIRYADGTYVCESACSGMKDVFGHQYLSGTAKVLENKVRTLLGYKARGIEINVTQRCAAHFASQTDIDEAFAVGAKAVEIACMGISGHFVYFKRISNSPYEIAMEHCPIELVANVEKKVPREWINAKGNDVTIEMINYLKPLIMGQPSLTLEDGLPVYMRLNKHL